MFLDPGKTKGPYAAVIPLFMESALSGQSPVINGDGKTSRDFTFVANVVQANLLSLFTKNKMALNQVYNIGFGQQTSLLQLVRYSAKISGSASNQYTHRKSGRRETQPCRYFKGENLTWI
jgi:UDP-N-acetylglucosamine 4-epimerase